MNNADTVRITAVIPAWNLTDVLKESVQSIRSQGEPAEIIIVDNASSTPLPRFPGATVVRLKKRVSVGEARNAGLAACQTPYVFFMDGDDEVLPGTLRFLRRRLERSPRAVAAAGANIDWNPLTGKRQRAVFPPGYAYGLQRFRRLFACLNVAFYMYPVIAVLIRTEAARQAGGFPRSNYRENWLFSMSLCFQGRVILERRPCKLYRTDPRRKTLTSIEPQDITQTLHDIDALMRPAGPIPRWCRSLRWLIRPLQIRYLTVTHKKRWAKRHGEQA